MKQKLFTLTKSLLCGCMALSWWAGFNVPSAILLGEYAYPKNEEK